jgi:hypothetical protein
MRPIALALYDRRDMHARRPMQTPLSDYGFSAAEAATLREQVLDAIEAMPAWKRARSAIVVRRDGVEVLERADLAQHYRRHGLRPLAFQVRQAPLGRVLLVLEGEPETTVLTVDGEAWLRAAGRTP